MNLEVLPYSWKPLNPYVVDADQAFDKIFGNEDDSCCINSSVRWDAGLIIANEVRSDINHAFNHLERGM